MKEVGNSSNHRFDIINRYLNLSDVPIVVGPLSPHILSYAFASCFGSEAGCFAGLGKTPQLSTWLAFSSGQRAWLDSLLLFIDRDLAQKVLEYPMIPGTDLPIAPEPSRGIPDIAAPSDERQGFGPKRMRMELPMIIQNMVLNFRPDSGSEENIIVADPVSELNLDIDMSPEHQKGVRIANGKGVKALGRILVACTFAKEPTVQVTCVFTSSSSS